MNKKLLNSIAIGAVAIAAFTTGIWFGLDKPQQSGSIMIQDRVITVLPTPKVLEPFQLRAGDEKPFTLESLKGRYSILFFGYTSCPDICPTTLQVLGQLYTNLQKKNGVRDLQVVFVSVDPKRDQPKKLLEYVKYFNANFAGVSGDPEQIAKFAAQLGAAYEVLDDGKSKNYGVNHTGLLFITNPEAQFAAVLSPPHEADLIESRLDLLKQLEQ